MQLVHVFKYLQTSAAVVRTNCRKFTVSYVGPILWNSFPQQLRQLPSEVLFKKKLKSTLLATY